MEGNVNEEDWVDFNSLEHCNYSLTDYDSNDSSDCEYDKVYKNIVCYDRAAYTEFV